MWLFDLAKAGPKEYQAWRSADRYSSAEIVALADKEARYRRRILISASEIQKSLRKMFRGDSEFSAGELAHILKNDGKQSTWISSLLAEARRCYCSNNGKSLESMVFPRIIHTLGAALSGLCGDGDIPVEKVLPGLSEKLTGAEHDWLDSVGVRLDSAEMLRQWAQSIGLGLSLQNIQNLLLGKILELFLYLTLPSSRHGME